MRVLTSRPRRLVLLAVALAIGRTGSTITTAGMILGGTFAVLAVAGGSAGGGQIQQIG